MYSSLSLTVSLTGTALSWHNYNITGLFNRSCENTDTKIIIDKIKQSLKLNKISDFLTSLASKLIYNYLSGILTRTRNITSLEKRRRMNPTLTLTRRTGGLGVRGSGRLFRMCPRVTTRLSTGSLVCVRLCNSCRPGRNVSLLQKTSAPTTPSPQTSIRKLTMTG